MNKNDFADEIKGVLTDKLGQSTEIICRSVTKNNGIELTGLAIRTPGTNISPTIYIDGFYEDYLRGDEIKCIAEKIENIYFGELPARHVNVDFFEDYGKVRHRICYRLINTKKNKVLLEKTPHIEYLDLSICFFYAFEEDTIEGAILIKNSHMKLWNVGVNDLMAEASRNTKLLFPWDFLPICRLLYGYDAKENEKDDKMYVLTNQKKLNGAGCILYEGVLGDMAKRLSDNLYIIPSSIHELIVLRETDVCDLNEVKRLINEVNENCVSPEDVLSDALYYYDRTKGELLIV